MTTSRRSALPLAALLFAGCAGEPDSTDADAANCEGAKCDDPNTVAMDGCRTEQVAATADPDAIAANCEPGESDSACGARIYTECREAAALDHCEDRRGEALECTAESRGSSFTPEAIRWQCADVSGVSRGGNFDASLPTDGSAGRGPAPGNGSGEQGDPTEDSRGQEYCEYFALVQLPGEDTPREIGRLLSRTKTTDHDLSELLTEDLRTRLDDEDDAVFGQCVFTSWHGDVTRPLEVCETDPTRCEALPPSDEAASWVPEDGLRFNVGFDTLAMKSFLNSNGAALDLVDQCLTAPEDHRTGATLSSDVEDEFDRGCLRAYELFSTEWRRSDPAVCTAAMRLRECGCGLDVDGDGTVDIATGDKHSSGRAALARVLLPAVNDEAAFLRGFPLGTWSDAHALPDGCRFVDISGADSAVNGGQGEDGQTLVTCDITSERIESAGFTVSQAFADMKTFCQSSYAQDVVVHVPIQGKHIPEASLVCNPPSGAINCEGLPLAVGSETGSQRAGLCD